MKSHTRRGDGGVALVITLLAISMFSAIGMGLMLTTSVERLTTANQRMNAEAVFAAEAAMQIALAELTAVADWTPVLNGTRVSVRSDGPPGVRQVPYGATLDLVAWTNELTCGRSTDCSDSRIRVSTASRPWGANNPKWQVFLSCRAAAVVPLPSPAAADLYLVVWFGDDAGETDGDRLRDGAGPGREGRHMLRARAAAVGARATRAILEAGLSRRCTVDAGGTETCESGIRVQSWRWVTDGDS